MYRRGSRAGVDRSVSSGYTVDSPRNGLWPLYLRCIEVRRVSSLYRGVSSVYVCSRIVVSCNASCQKRRVAYQASRRSSSRRCAPSSRVEQAKRRPSRALSLPRRPRHPTSRSSTRRRKASSRGGVRMLLPYLVCFVVFCIASTVNRPVSGCIGVN